MKKVGQLYRDSLIKEVKSEVEKSNSLFVLSYTCVAGPRMNDLRKNLKKSGLSVYVSKNSIARIALKDLKQDELAEKVDGQSAFVLGNLDSVEASKAIVKCLKDNESVVLKGGLIDGKIYQKDEIKRLSELPSREALLSQLLSLMQSPVSRLLGAMNAKSRDLLSILKQLSEKKGGS